MPRISDRLSVDDATLALLKERSSTTYVDTRIRLMLAYLWTIGYFTHN